MDEHCSNDNDIAIRLKRLTRAKYISDRDTALMTISNDRLSRYPRVTVEGHGESFRADDVRMVLLSFFTGCAEIVLPKATGSEYTEGCGFMYFMDEAWQQRALALSGSNVGFPFPGIDWLGGWDVVVKAIPNRVCEFTPDQVAAAHRHIRARQTGFVVSGYPTWLPVDVVRSALFRLFSSCGEIIYVHVHENKPGALKSAGYICLSGGDEVLEKAAALDGTDMGGWNVVVTTGPNPNASGLVISPDEANMKCGWDGPPGRRWWEYKHTQ